MKVCHIVNSFDPSFDALRCVRELNKYSSHSHTIYVAQPHPAQDVYQFDQPERPGWEMSSEEKTALVDEADVLIHHFTGWEGGLGSDTKPSAFRNLNIYYDWDIGRSWTEPHYNALSYDRYKLVSSCHLGALDFMPNDRFRFLPDLLPLDGAYSFDPADRPQPTISYIKHADTLNSWDFGDVAHLDCYRTPHAELLAKRRSLASVVIDNISDGHFGEAGQEAAILGLPVMGFWCKQTTECMRSWGRVDPGFPFTQVTTLDEAVHEAVWAARMESSAYRSRRRAIRKWSEKWFDPRRLVNEYWEPFIKELAS